ncbi:hypothetical protein [Pseudolactococcus insecticola]|uniref:Metallo-beta-lactamase domain-containing protein n=1 Tax=Pseudolactococcus insecticola TaxID=2709158 RepID=A0A6A0BC76_9LACT|nr:hypothetical protein [Lactococcus insecticola]GFH41427.1 hypothetical protein Hs20B_18250 [Lactococcus insecticola]
MTIKYAFKYFEKQNTLINLSEYGISEDVSYYIELLSSSSKGNSVFIKPLKLLIDLGLPLARYTEIDPDYFLKVKYIVITHIHGDHLNGTTLKKVLKSYPHIKIFLTEFSLNYIKANPEKSNIKGLYSHILDYAFENPNNIILINTSDMPISGYTNEEDGIKILFYNVSHGDLINIALEFAVQTPTGMKKFLYATDLDTIDSQYYLENDITKHTDIYQNGKKQQIYGLPLEKITFDNVDNKYDFILLEANYNAKLLNQLIEGVKFDLQKVVILPEEKKELTNRLTRMESNKRHISEEQSIQYVKANIKNGGIFIPLHASSEFGTYHQR